MRSQMLELLNREWASQDHRVEREVISWGYRHQALAGCRSTADVLDRITERPDETLAALIRSDRDGSALAGRAVLQTMLGKMVVMAAADRDNSLDDYISALWCEIRTYPLPKRPSSIAANLALDTRKAVRRNRIRQSRLVAGEVTTSLPSDPTTARVVELSAMRVLRVARELGLIDEATRRLLVAVYAEGRRGRDVAERCRLSHTTVRFRCSRAVRRLSAHAVELAAAA